jgi:hypothetical protein
MENNKSMVPEIKMGKVSLNVKRSGSRSSLTPSISSSICSIRFVFLKKILKLLTIPLKNPPWITIIVPPMTVRNSEQLKRVFIHDSWLKEWL